MSREKYATTILFNLILSTLSLINLGFLDMSSSQYQGLMTYSSVVICRNPFLRLSIRFKYICNHPRISANSLFIYFWVISDSDRLGLLNSLLYVNLAPVSVMIPHTERAGSCSIWRQRLFNCTHSLVSRLNRRVHLMRNLRNTLDLEKLHIQRMSATKYYFKNPKINHYT